MTKNRLEAFSDGVLAIIITIMVLELKVPKGATLEALMPLSHVFLGYVLSFIFVGIYWNNHHHLISAVHRVNPKIMWANLHFLFWLSLAPFATGWAGESHFASLPTALYGFVLLGAAIAYFILQTIVIAYAPENSSLKEKFGADLKGKLSVLLYIIGIIFAFYYPQLSMLIYAGVAVMWIVPDNRLQN